MEATEWTSFSCLWLYETHLAVLKDVFVPLKDAEPLKHTAKGSQIAFSLDMGHDDETKTMSRENRQLVTDEPVEFEK